MKNAKTLAAILVASAIALPAQAEFSGNLGVTSNYLWRGVTQTDDDVAVSGGLDYGHDSGFYAGTWASNVDFGGDATYELDLYAGYGFELADFAFDLGYIYYFYPDSNDDGDIGFGEVYGSVGWEWLSFGASYMTNAEDDASDEEDALYLEANADFEIYDSLTLGLHVGSYSGDTIEDEWFGEDYIDYSVSLTKTIEFGEFTFAVSDTDLDDDDPVVLLSWAHEFSM